MNYGVDNVALKLLVLPIGNGTVIGVSLSLMGFYTGLKSSVIVVHLYDTLLFMAMKSLCLCVFLGYNRLS
ncbi:hypothetical protein XELAEV_18034367mg [Xenopus laevis]|uniref:Uncharacterized protein n=1 Tax=Xenopus laevis TaxID=8355 RepID=A0A974HB10_XENLA|nr:hypothetical protein XELAEV_18034367mg [Xenopus laevis]